MKKSEYIKAFLDFLRESELQYRFSHETVETEDKRCQDLLHAIEFEPSSKERSKICTRLRNSRIKRRENKDTVEELQPIMDYLKDYKRAVDQLGQVLGAVRKIEKYHANRSYKPRVEKEKE